MNKIERIKYDFAEYVRNNIALDLETDEYRELKRLNRKQSLYDLPEAYQEKVIEFAKRYKKEIGKIDKIALAGSMYSGSNIIPNVTNPRLIHLRNTVSRKKKKEKSDIDLLMLTKEGYVIGTFFKIENEVVNIEALPQQQHQKGTIIYENGKWK